MTPPGRTGEPLGAVPWEAVIDFIQGYVKEDQSHRAVRNPRSRLAAKVRFLTPDHKHLDSVTCEIGGGGVFIETRSAAAVRDSPRTGTRPA